MSRGSCSVDVGRFVIEWALAGIGLTIMAACTAGLVLLVAYGYVELAQLMRKYRRPNHLR